MNILGISCYYHDAAACLVVDGVVVAAAAEERFTQPHPNGAGFTRVKHDNNFPENAIRFCLSWASLTPADIDAVVFYEKPVVKFDRMLRQHFANFPTSRKIFVDTIGSWFNMKLQVPKTLKKTIGYTGPVRYLPHHFSHAASAYYLSGFERAAIVTIDGVGEWATTTMGLGENGKIAIDKEIRFPHSLGLLYSAMTSYLGFEVNDAEYKVMGLAAYGDPKPFRRQMNELVNIFPDGSYALNLKYFDYVRTDRMFNKHLEELFGHPMRNPESLMERLYENIAASLQEKLETVVFHLLAVAHKRYKTDNLCLAGGVALNSVMNGKILKNTPFKRLYIPPDPGDGGGAMGAALAWWHQQRSVIPAKAGIQRTKNWIRPRAGGDQVGDDKMPFSPYLGPSFPEEQMEDVLVRHGLSYTRLDRKVLVECVAGLLSQEKIIGWFQGRMEWGPRALGNRSILASAARAEMKDIINSKVKHRELFRPFAPVVLAHHVKDYFITDSPVPVSAKYMLFVYPFRPKGKREVPAVVHVDGTGRLQTLERVDNPLYYDLIEAYAKKTSVPIIINTSFNVRGEPIVCTPQDAVHCFLKTDIDYLVMGPFIVKK
ncbi:MAG: carbamoyltransferase N-terminal domain-containing protein [Patescibacteria group bacterium]